LGNIPRNLPTTTPETRRDIYKDLEHLLFVGFVNKPLVINGIQLGLRTPHPSDLLFLKTFSDSLPIKKHKNILIARCIWRVDHFNILGDTSSFSKVFQIVETLPKNIISILYNILMYLLQEANTLQEGVEPYSYEFYSRYFWKSLQGLSPCDPKFTNIPGTDFLGLNNHQRSWSFYNSLEDKRSDEMISWSESKFIASAMIGKGIQKVNSSDQNNRKKEDSYRQAVRDAFYYFRIGVIDYSDYKQILSGNAASAMDEANELEDQMQKVISGEKDEHDILIEMAQRKMLEEAFPTKTTSKIDPESLLGNNIPKVVGYTPEQMQKLLQERKIKTTPKKVISQQQAYFLQNLIKPIIKPGRLVIQGDNITVEDSEVLTDSLNKDELVDREMSLNDLLSSRKVLVE
jgi:hypothetical protein